MMNNIIPNNKILNIRAVVVFIYFVLTLWLKLQMCFFHSLQLLMANPRENGTSRSLLHLSHCIHQYMANMQLYKETETELLFSIIEYKNAIEKETQLAKISIWLKKLFGLRIIRNVI